ncbi:MAG: hypothetical protein U9Q21_02635 [Candidatus Auribacterota bacterium]|nr:hypothetical protein [Candidatus Auribacterota bacterium]
MIKVTINEKDKARYLAALLKVPDQMLKRVRVALKDGLWDIAFYAGRNHRYQAQSGRLDSAYAVVASPSGLVAEVLLTKRTSGTPYAHRIHEGWGTWKPDQFLYRAARDLGSNVEQSIISAIDKAIKEAGF